ncbi:Dehydrogese/reductase SDR family protein 7like [Daphnia sinensis]|uniref:Dehydrogese/reductase SDR family protein 7like n=1 Tax=Daphnia sinensis TaxID=1820382 RepID=A0AAD5PN63_9CRUS|nr:Dehydrogese/reductase SDR family protein 7like [Daphnia sinensis]
MNFKNKKVWITGASSGIGEALSYAFATEGAHLILSARNVVELERVKSKCQGAAAVDIVPLDLHQHTEVFEIAKRVLETIGSVDILINNAGIAQFSLARETHFDVDTQLINVNLLGPIALTKALLPSMTAQKSGHIVVVSSLLGKFSVPMRSTYAATKHGLHGYFDALRAECFDDGIKVLMVCPGYVRTNISLKALTADGSYQGTMDETLENGLDPSFVARHIIKAIRKGKQEVNIAGLREAAAAYLKRFFPTLLSVIVRKVKTA